MGDILEINFQRLEGRAVYAPWVDATVHNMFVKGVGIRFKMRIDTGADISCVPEEAVAGVDLTTGRSVRIATLRGTARQKTKMATILIHNGDDVWMFRPEHGVLISKDSVGLLGMDILGQLSMLMMDETVILERKGN